MTVTTPLRELAALSLRLGVTAFGGPAAHVALMRDRCSDNDFRSLRVLDVPARSQASGGRNLKPPEPRTGRKVASFVDWRRQSE